MQQLEWMLSGGSGTHLVLLLRITAPVITEYWRAVLLLLCSWYITTSPASASVRTRAKCTGEDQQSARAQGLT